MDAVTSVFCPKAILYHGADELGNRVEFPTPGSFLRPHQPTQKQCRLPGPVKPVPLPPAELHGGV